MSSYAIIYHSGTKGQKWGKRQYQYEDGSLTPLGRIHYGVGAAREKVKSTGEKISESSKQAATKTAQTAKKLASTGKQFADNHPVLMTGLTTALISFSPIPGLSVVYNMSKAYETQQVKAEEKALLEKRVQKLNRIQRQVNKLTV
jgi:cell division protein FtsL